MTRHVLSIQRKDSLGQAIRVMAWSGVRHLPVLEDRKVVGVLTEGDLLARRTAGQADIEAPVSQVMKHPAELAGPEDDLRLAAARMVERRIGCLPVVREGALVGILTRSDVLAQEAYVQVPAGTGTLRVSQAMNAGAVVVHGDDELLEAAARMTQYGIRHLPVIDGEGRVFGMLSDRDIRTAVGDPRRALEDEEIRQNIRALRVWAVMATPVLTVTPDQPLSDAVHHFVDERVGALPVVDSGGRPVGMLSYVDALRALDDRTRAFER